MSMTNIWIGSPSPKKLLGTWAILANKDSCIDSEAGVATAFINIFAKYYSLFHVCVVAEIGCISFERCICVDPDYVIPLISI